MALWFFSESGHRQIFCSIIFHYWETSWCTQLYCVRIKRKRSITSTTSVHGEQVSVISSLPFYHLLLCAHLVPFGVKLQLYHCVFVGNFLRQTVVMFNLKTHFRGCKQPTWNEYKWAEKYLKVFRIR